MTALQSMCACKSLLIQNRRWSKSDSSKLWAPYQFLKLRDASRLFYKIKQPSENNFATRTLPIMIGVSLILIFCG